MRKEKVFIQKCLRISVWRAMSSVEKEDGVFYEWMNHWLVLAKFALCKEAFVWYNINEEVGAFLLTLYADIRGDGT